MDNAEYVVCDEHTFGILHTDRDTIEILALHTSKGATFEYLPEPKMKSQYANVREATSEDFEEFRIYQEKT